MRNTFFAIIALFSIVSCTKEIEYKGGYDGEKLVLLSCANPDKPLTARVFKSVFIYSRNQEDCTNGLKGATVVAVVNDKDTYPFKEVVTKYEEGSEGYYFNNFKKEVVEYVSDYTPKIGDRITVKASHSGFKDVQGSTVVPERPKVKLNSRSLITQQDNDFWVRYNFSVTIDDPAETENFYRLNAFGEDNTETYPDGSHPISWFNLYSKDILFYDSSIGGMIDSIDDAEYYVPDYFDDGGFSGQSHKFDVWFSVFNDPDGGTTVDMDKYTVTVDNITESLYLYLRSNASAGFGLGSAFSEATIIYTNIENGMGCVGAISGVELPLSTVPQS